MHNVWIVAAREYRERVKTPVFIFTTLMVLLMTLAMPVMVLFISGQVFPKTHQVALFDQTGKVGTTFMANQPPGEDELSEKTAAKWEITTIRADQIAEYETQARAGKIFGVLRVEGTYPRDLKLTFAGSGATNLSGATPLEKAITRQAQEAVAKTAGLDDATTKFLSSPTKLTRVDLSSGGKQDEESALLKLALGMMVMMLVYMSVLTSGSMLFQGVLEEKTSRVVELMAAAVKPMHMMLGKIIGLGLLSLTQFAAAIVAFMGFTALAATLAIKTGSISLGTLLIVALLGILGYFMYAALFAAAGAMVNRMEDSGMAMMPIMIPIVLPVMFSQAILSSPDSNLAVAASLFPLFTPTIMAQRLILTNPPLWQVLTSVGLVVVTAIVLTSLAGRIYRVGILTYGNRPSFKQLWVYLKG